MVARVWVSPLICTPSLASTAWWSPSAQRRPGNHAAGELVHDEHLAVLHQVVHFLLVERVRLQQLVNDVQFLALGGVLPFHLLPRGALLGRVEIGVPLDPVHRFRDVGHQKQGRIVRRRARPRRGR